MFAIMHIDEDGWVEMVETFSTLSAAVEYWEAEGLDYESYSIHDEAGAEVTPDHLEGV